MKERILRRYVWFAIAGLLLAISLLPVLTVTEARYKTGAGGSDQARVARFDIDVSEPRIISETDTLSSDNPTKTVVYLFVIRNRSEVTINYKLRAETLASVLSFSFSPSTGRLPAGKSISIRATVKLAKNSPHGDTVSDIRFFVDATQVSP